MMEPIRVALLGTGYIADWHAKALTCLKDVQLWSVCDQNRTRAEAFARRHRATRVHQDVTGLLADGPLDAVHVLLPPEHHFAAARAVLEAGCHVVLEKPMCTSVEECETLERLAREKQRQVWLNHNLLFYPAYEKLKADVSAGLLGRIDQLTLVFNKNLAPPAAAPDVWMFREPENFIMDCGPHAVAHLLDLLGGRPDELHARASNPCYLTGRRPFYRRWTVEAYKGPTCVTLQFSFVPAFTEHLIHVRGSIASATADLQNNTYVVRRHTGYADEFDRYLMSRRATRDEQRQAGRNLGHYLLSLCKIVSMGDPYGQSFINSLGAFYSGMHQPVDYRGSAGLATAVVQVCDDIGQAAPKLSRKTHPSIATMPRLGSKPEILVIGATGFIGKELVRQLLARGRALRLLVRNASNLPEELQSQPVEVVEGRLDQAADIDKAVRDIPVVYHLAYARDARTWEEYYQRDLLVTQNLAKWCLNNGIKRFIYTSTISCYETSGKGGVITEETPLNPQADQCPNLYARVKAASERLLMQMHAQEKFPVVILRPGIVIGRGGNLFHNGVGSWTRNQSVCSFWGRGDYPLPFVLCEDVAAALVAAGEVPGLEGQSFNLVAGPDVTARDYLAELERQAGLHFLKISRSVGGSYALAFVKWLLKCLVRHPRRQRPSYRNMRSLALRARFDCSRARRVLGWQPTMEREQFLHKGIGLPAAEHYGVELKDDRAVAAESRVNGKPVEEMAAIAR
jgi:nucleoside-diphosphate-sugar epimerase/predicted dehydrogenase